MGASRGALVAATRTRRKRAPRAGTPQAVRARELCWRSRRVAGSPLHSTPETQPGTLSQQSLAEALGSDIRALRLPFQPNVKVFASASTATCTTVEALPSPCLAEQRVTAPSHKTTPSDTSRAQLPLHLPAVWLLGPFGLNEADAIPTVAIVLASNKSRVLWSASKYHLPALTGEARHSHTRCTRCFVHFHCFLVQPHGLPRFHVDQTGVCWVKLSD